ncbi:hypothetical protein GOODEAATRI_016629 [Goodea atripinnis]|uniref:Ig-like domain-containing protein n=1 Tax=Goodea atripinnis TaxID=208336 RepID=A0ABV0PYI4_9TELE
MVWFNSASGDKVTVSCLALDFYPQSLSFEWSDASGAQLDSARYPVVEANNRFTEVSLVQVSRSEANLRSYQCSVIHPGGTKTVNAKNGTEPKVTVHLLHEKDIGQEASAEVTLVCLVSSNVVQDYYIAWTEDVGQSSSVYYDGITFPPRKTKNGYSVTSVYTTTKEKWNGGYIFYCNVWPTGLENHMKSRGVSQAMGNSTECETV